MGLRFSLFLYLFTAATTTESFFFSAYICSPYFVGIQFLFHCSVDRLNYLPHLLRRWKGYISLAVIADTSELPAVQKVLRSLRYRKHVRISLYIPGKQNYVWIHPEKKIVKSNRIYPINLLRDIAILNCITTHYVNLDMDLWPSDSLLTTFQSLPFSLTQLHKAALILPAFQFTPSLRSLYGSQNKLTDE